MYMYEAGRSASGARLRARAMQQTGLSHRLCAAAAYSGNFYGESCASDAKALLAAPAMGSFIEVDPED